MTREVDVDGKHYRIDKLSAMEQWHVARRLAPFLTALGEGMNGRSVSLESLRQGEVPLDQMMLALEPIAKALSVMSDEDSERIIRTALSVVYRQDAGGWQRLVEPRSKQFQYQDLQMPQMIQLTYESLVENLGSFFSTSQSNLPPPAPQT